MEDARRSGADRRGTPEAVDNDLRSGEERRAARRDSKYIIECMKKIPIFGGLTGEQYRRMLNICSKRIIPVDDYLVREGGEAVELFILMKGKLKVVTKTGALLAHITTLGLVGEMGVFTGTPRSASVIATDDCVVLRISKKELFELFSLDYALGNRILLNVINDLAFKLQEDNVVIEDLRKRRGRIL